MSNNDLDFRYISSAAKTRYDDDILIFKSFCVSIYVRYLSVISSILISNISILDSFTKCSNKSKGPSKLSIVM